jgi:methionine synthase I (cobalamin-dependent)
MNAKFNSLRKQLDQIRQLINNMQEDVESMEDTGLKLLLAERLQDLKSARAAIAQAINFYGVK